MLLRAVKDSFSLVQRVMALGQLPGSCQLQGVGCYRIVRLHGAQVKIEFYRLEFRWAQKAKYSHHENQSCKCRYCYPYPCGHLFVFPIFDGAFSERWGPFALEVLVKRIGGFVRTRVVVAEKEICAT